MGYSTEQRFGKHVEGYSFLSFAIKFGNKYGKKLMDTATKAGIDSAKTTSKRVVQKTAEATGDLIQIKYPINLIYWANQKTPKKVEEIYIPPEKRQQVIDGLKLF